MVVEGAVAAYVGPYNLIFFSGLMKVSLALAFILFGGPHSLFLIYICIFLVLVVFRGGISCMVAFSLFFKEIVGIFMLYMCLLFIMHEVVSGKEVVSKVQMLSA